MVLTVFLKLLIPGVRDLCHFNASLEKTSPTLVNLKAARKEIEQVCVLNTWHHLLLASMK